MPKKHGRHTAAFLLLFLADGPSYGALLLKRLENEIPYCFSDSAIVYRSLQEMERSGLIEGRWEMPDTGQPRKWYAITAKGEKELAAQAEDIRQRHANLEFFLSRYQARANAKDNTAARAGHRAGDEAHNPAAAAQPAEGRHADER